MRVLRLLCLVTAVAAGPAFAGVGEHYGTRDPAVCASRTSPPSSPAVAAAYFACDEEDRMSNTDALGLVTDVKVQVARARPYDTAKDAGLERIDVSQPVYDIRGSYRFWTCWRDDSVVARANPGKNCRSGPQPAAIGSCWADTFGDWHCLMTDPHRIDTTDMPYVPPPDQLRMPPR